MDVVRKIIADHGKDTMPTEIVSFAKKEHGIDLGVSTASNYKSAIVKELGSRRKAESQARTEAGLEESVSNGTARSGAGISIHDIEAVKKLVEQMGADKVEQLAMVLAK